MADNLTTTTSKEEAKHKKLQQIKRRLIWFMLGSTLLTFTVVGCVIAAVIYKVLEKNKNSFPATQLIMPPAQNLSPLLKGAKLLSFNISGDRLCLHVVLSSGKQELIIYNYMQRKLLACLLVN